MGEQLTVLVPGAGASVAYLRPLALEFAAFGPVVGVNTAGTPGIVPAGRSAALEIVRQIGETGDVRVVVMGHSWGGLVAVEVVRSLQSMGREVAALVLLDSAEPDACLRTGLGRFRQSFRSVVHRRRNRRPLVAHGAVPRPGPNFGEGHAVHSEPNRAAMSSVGDDEFHRQMAGVATYRLRPVTVPTILVRTGPDDSPTQWHRVTLAGFQRIQAAGRHTSMLAEPFVARLGISLRAEVANVVDVADRQRPRPR